MSRHVSAAVAAILPAAAWAHTGVGEHGAPFVSGLVHPVLGADHLIAMVAVGVFAATYGGVARLACPAAFVGGMLAGGALGYGGAGLPIVEPVILASVVVLGGAIAVALRPPLASACVGIALFGAAHGYAHGLEGPALGGLAYALGFALATAALHALGLALALTAGGLGRPAIARALGGLAVLGGVALAAG